MTSPEAVSLHVLLLPRARILEGAPELRNVLVRPLSGARGMGRVACETIARAIDAGTDEMGEIILRQVRLALLEQAGIAARCSSGELLRERAAALIGDRLRDPGLDIEAIAQALSCSKRALHKAFEKEGLSVHRHLWHARLEHARRQLEDPRAAERSITSILHGAGFNSAAHFSRLFRQTYDASPREWRAAARPTASSASPAFARA